MKRDIGVLPRRARKLPRFTDRYTLQSSPLQVSPYCIGQVRDPQVIRRAFDLGINFFFVSADLHWPSYEQTRLGLQDLFENVSDAREKVCVAIVSYVSGPGIFAAALRDAANAIEGLECVDLIVIGGVESGSYISRLAAARDLVDRCYLGASALGASFHSRSAARLSIPRCLVDLAFIRYHAAYIDAQWAILPYTRSIPRSLVYNFNSTRGFVDLRSNPDWAEAGYWSPEITDHYRFALSYRGIDGILCSPVTVPELEALSRAVELAPLTLAEENHLIGAAVVHSGEVNLREE